MPDYSTMIICTTFDIPRDLTASSESLLEILNNTPSSVQQSPSHYDRVTGRPRKWGGGRGGGGGSEDGESRDGGGRESDNVSRDEEKGFEYTTTANIARHLRSDTRGGE